MTRLVCSFIALLLLSLPVQAIIVCHDYTLYRIAGADPRPKTGREIHGTDVASLRRYLETHGYKKFPYGNASADPDRAGRILKPGDVIILRDAHSGFVNAQGLIDHFIQVYGSSGKKYDVDNLPRHENLSGKVGGLYQDETLRDFLSRPFYQGQDRRLEIWRKVGPH